MAFDTQTRNALARLTADARSLLVDEFTKQLQSVYGIQPTGQISDIDTLGHLDDEQRAVAGVLRDRIHHLTAGSQQDKKALAEAVGRVIREQAFTILNRFAALRMCEERGIVQQCVGNGVLSKGFQVYLQTAGSGLGEQYERYRTYLFCIFDEIAVDLGILFDRYSPYGLLFPREPALFELLEILNRKDLSHVWVEDEAIGWIYQYFNSKEERQQMRKASAAPRNSRELAVRNQFFTPRYVVEFLSDNTLGRIWYEMRKGDTALKDQCRYMVRRPNEIFLAEGEELPKEELTANNHELSQEELLKQPVYIPHRPLKDPRQIRMLDPACGSMHSGLYCFDLFETIYSEAWDIARSGSLPDGADASFADFCRLTEKYATKADFLRDVPAMIIEHNIHGIDIDPRCAQIAGLSLWLRAQKAWKLQGIKPADRPRITKSNIVCAEPMPGDKELLKEFTSALNPPLLGQIVERVWDAMQLAGEAGSLLKIEEQIASWVTDAKTQWKALPKASQMLLFEPRAAYGSEPSQAELKLDLTGISDEAFWEQAEERIYAALENYSNQAAGAGNVAQKLFADDAAKGFAFIDLCRKRYDAVVMNPPYGTCSESALSYIRSRYRDAHNDIFIGFVERVVELIENRGSFGAITSRNFMFNQRLAAFREEFILNKTQARCLADLGNQVLDAAVDVAAFVAELSQNDDSLGVGTFFNLLNIGDKGFKLAESIETARNGEPDRATFIRNVVFFRRLPDYRISYTAPLSVVGLFGLDTLEPAVGTVLKGLITGNDERYVRASTEVPLAKERCWSFFHKGGDYSPFYSDILLMLNWNGDGSELKADAAQKYGSASRTIKNEQFFGRMALGWGVNNSVGFATKCIPKGCVFADIGPVFQPDKTASRYQWLGYSNSLIVKMITRLFQAGERGRFMWIANIVKQLPIPKKLDDFDAIPEGARKASELFLAYESCNEISPRFSGGIFKDLELSSDSLEFLRKDSNRILDCDKQMLGELCEKIDEASEAAFGIDLHDAQDLRSTITTAEDPRSVLELSYRVKNFDSAESSLSFVVGCITGRWDISYATGQRQSPELPDSFDPLPLCPPGMLQNAEGLPAEPKDVPDDYPLRISWPGILVDDENHQEDIVSRLEDALKVIWKDNWESIEQEACEILGLKTLRDYFAEKKSGSKFFTDHLSRYSKSRRQAPIYWPLSTESGSYTLWIYYHRLDAQMLFKCVTDFLEPKIRTVSADIDRLQKSLADGGTATARDELDAMLDFRIELDNMKAELLRVAHLPYKPDLNDGVIINAAPLWTLFSLKKWQKACNDCWDKLEAGDYDWAHMSFNIWPGRVREKCRTDKSLAIAHDLEDVYEEPPEKPKKRKGKFSQKLEPEPEAELNYDD